MFCNKCRSQLLEGAEFCQKCGAKVVEGGTVRQPTIPQSPMATQSNTVLNQDAIKAKIPLNGISGDKPSLIDQILLKRKKKQIIAAIGGLLVVFIVVQIYLMNALTPEMKSQEEFVELSDGTIVDRKDWESGYLPEHVVNDLVLMDELEDIIVPAKWGYHALIPDQIGDLRGWDLPQDIWNNLFGEDHTGDDDFAYAVEIGRGVKVPMYEVLSHMMEAADTSENPVSASEEVSGTTLSETYINEEEGFSLSYPSDWAITEGESLIDDTAIVMLEAPTNGDNYSRFLVNKGAADYAIFDYTESDFLEEFSPMFDEVSVGNLSHEEISGVPAVALGLEITEDGVPIVMLRYYYIIDDVVYIVSFATNHEADLETLEAIDNSYEITATSASSPESMPSISTGEILYDGSALDSEDDEAFTETTYLVEYSEGVSPEYYPVIIIEPDGSFAFLVNLYEGMNYVYGWYEFTEDALEFHITENERIVSPYEFSMTNTGRAMIFSSDSNIGITKPDSIFGWSEEVPESVLLMPPYPEESTLTADIGNRDSIIMQVSTPDGSPLRLREGPGTEYNVIMEIPNGESVLLEDGEAVDGWLNVTYVFSGIGYETGWVSAEYLVQSVD